MSTAHLFSPPAKNAQAVSQWLRTTLLVAVVATGLSACGLRGTLTKPPGQPPEPWLGWPAKPPASTSQDGAAKGRSQTMPPMGVPPADGSVSPTTAPPP